MLHREDPAGGAAQESAVPQRAGRRVLRRLEQRPRMASPVSFCAVADIGRPRTASAVPDRL